MFQLSFSFDSFMRDFWQKKPTVIKGGFANFQDPLSPDELAGLSMEEIIDSRFISNQNDEWQAEHGPFTEEKFAELGEENWSLIVQAVNHWHQDAAQLIKPFSAMPQWLFDDLMISFATKGGGVGPHIDQYDVFICQGIGKRHWRVGAKDEGQYEEVSRHAALRQIEGFEPIIDTVLETGDILYIPPGFPHDGIALEDSMSYSVGYRSPKEQELISNFADYILANDIGDTHLHNPEQKLQSAHGMIQTEDTKQLTKMLLEATQSQDLIDDFMGCMLSQSRHQLDLVEAETPWEADEVLQQIQLNDSFYKVSGLRALYHEHQPEVVYINGEVFKLEGDAVALTSLLCDNEAMTGAELSQFTGDHDVVMMLTDLLNKGYWYVQ